MESNRHIFRTAVPADLHTLRQLAFRTFRESYEVHNDPQNFQVYLQEAFDLPRFRTELEDPKGSFFLCQKGHELLGYAKINRGKVPNELEGQKVIELQRIYVLQQAKGQGIGKQLLHLSLDTAARESFQKMWLGVWKKNPYAIEFYKRQGFSIIGEHDFVLGNDVQSDWVMVKSL